MDPNYHELEHLEFDHDHHIKKTKRWVVVTSFIVILLVLGGYFLQFYEASEAHTDSNFNIEPQAEMQYYHNMKYQSSNISYKILECGIKKENDMRYALNIMSNLTILKFHEVQENEEILVTCQDKYKLKSDYSIVAGEGGPVSATQVGDNIIITKGQVLLMKNSDCSRPIVAIHELLHALGFIHSENPGNLMFPTSGCSRGLGEDVVSRINEIYG